MRFAESYCLQAFGLSKRKEFESRNAFVHWCTRVDAVRRPSLVRRMREMSAKSAPLSLAHTASPMISTRAARTGFRLPTRAHPHQYMGQHRARSRCALSVLQRTAAKLRIHASPRVHPDTRVAGPGRAYPRGHHRQVGSASLPLSAT